jgi:hypothetical protein
MCDCTRSTTERSGPSAYQANATGGWVMLDVARLGRRVYRRAPPHAPHKEYCLTASAGTFRAGCITVWCCRAECWLVLIVRSVFA